jgi:hypothetical protein
MALKVKMSVRTKIVINNYTIEKQIALINYDIQLQQESTEIYK